MIRMISDKTAGHEVRLPLIITLGKRALIKYNYSLLINLHISIIFEGFVAG